MACMCLEAFSCSHSTAAREGNESGCELWRGIPIWKGKTLYKLLLFCLILQIFYLGGVYYRCKEPWKLCEDIRGSYLIYEWNYALQKAANIIGKFVSQQFLFIFDVGSLFLSIKTAYVSKAMLTQNSYPICIEDWT